MKVFEMQMKTFVLSQSSVGIAKDNWKRYRLPEIENVCIFQIQIAINLVSQ